ncbi:MAG: hypothetical protein LBH35_05320 [Treponema sp.]|jgi:hypothetical protein|nr:hypothetical protein [Treponema sp.]
MAEILSKPNINKMFILDTNISSYYFDDRIEDNVYTIDDPRLTIAATDKDHKGMYAALNEHINRFLNSPQPITVLDYAPNTAVALKQLHDSFIQECLGHLLFITFIHSDEECKYLGFSKYEDAIWQKYEFINSFLLFPFINKIEIPAGFFVEQDYINSLFMTVHSCSLLPEVSDGERAVCTARKRRKKSDKPT